MLEFEAKFIEKTSIKGRGTSDRLIVKVQKEENNKRCGCFAGV